VERWAISSYRTNSGAKVDLVIERDADIVAIEIKSGRQVSRSQTRGLHSFEETVAGCKPVKKIVAYRAEVAQQLEGGVDVLPYAELLERLRAEG
jgi:predicted AAA+ superfamily ATPase